MTTGAGSRADEREALLERFASLPDRLASAARAADGQPVPEGEWTAADVVRHLIAVEDEVHRARLADLDDSDEPYWSWTEPGAPGFDDAPLDTILGAFAVARAGTVDVVRGLGDAGWARAGVHQTFGRLDVAGLLRLAIDHDEEHLAGLPSTD